MSAKLEKAKDNIKSSYQILYEALIQKHRFSTFKTHYFNVEKTISLVDILDMKTIAIAYYNKLVIYFFNNQYNERLR